MAIDAKVSLQQQIEAKLMTEVTAFDALKQPEIVRCKDCIHWDEGHTEECTNLDSVCFRNGLCKPDWYCADGERKAVI